MSGAQDNYKFDVNNPVVTTRAMAEGSIEGEAGDYQLATPFDTAFAYSRFKHHSTDVCPPRGITTLKGMLSADRNPSGTSFTSEVFDE